MKEFQVELFFLFAMFFAGVLFGIVISYLWVHP